MNIYQTFLSDIPLCENDDFIVYGNEVNRQYAIDSMKYVTAHKSKILSFFGLTNYKKTYIHVYDDPKIFLKYNRQFYQPSSYCKANYVNNSVNILNTDFNRDDKGYIARIFSATHEFIHLVYRNRIQEKGDNKRVVWLDEGLAELLSGKYSGINSPEKMKCFLDQYVTGIGKEIPPVTFFQEHGSSYGKFQDNETQKYSGYLLSYLMVRYLTETMEKSDFLEFISNYNLIKEKEASVLENSIKYYVSAAKKI